MLVIIVGKEPEKIRGASAAVEAAGFETECTFDEPQALAALARAASVFAIVMGGVIDDAAYERIARAAPPGVLLLRTKIGDEDARTHFEHDVVPRLRAARVRVAVVVGSIRERRFADVPTRWLQSVLVRRSEVAVELLDLRDFPLPFFDHPTAPALKKQPYPDANVERWTAAVARAQAFVMISPEYNHGYTAVLKNALDWVYREWQHKPLGFVAYGNVGGARAVEQLREVAVELQMVPIRRAVHVPPEIAQAHARGEPIAEKLRALEPSADAMLDELLAWQRRIHLEPHRS